MKYLIILLILLINSFAFANDCSSLKFLAEYEYSQFNSEGAYVIYKEKRKLPHKWNDNDDVFLAIIIEGQFIEQLAALKVTYTKNEKTISSNHLNKTIHVNFENYFVIKNEFFLIPNKRPFEITLSLSLADNVCTHKILIGGDH